MSKSSYRKRKRQARRVKMILSISAMAVLLLMLAAGGIYFFVLKAEEEKPLYAADYLTQFYQLEAEQKYDEMYAMLTEDAKNNISQENFVERYSNIMSGIEADNIQIAITEDTGEEYPDTATISYTVTMETVAGTLSYDNSALLTRNEEKVYEINWDTKDIYPTLDSTDKIKVSTSAAKRGSITDRDGNLLAGEGTAYLVGVVPGKLQEPLEDTYEQIAELLEISVEDIEDDLSASWVKDDSFVELRVISYDEQDLKDQLLEIPGIMITDKTLRVYPLGEAAAHITGYIQSITAEELEELEGEGYTSASVLGKAGLENAYEDRLHGSDGVSIDIYDEDGTLKMNMVKMDAQDGEDIQVTLDSSLQQTMYEQLKEDAGCGVAMDPDTGEILAVVSTPSYDPNDFVMGYISSEWESLNADENQPFYTRFISSFVPGSSFKPIVASIGLTEGTLDPDEDVTNDGLSWQKDESWGDYYVTTLEEYSPKNLQNALIFSDNIYFAKVATNIGVDAFQNQLTALGFGESIPFALSAKVSSFGTDGEIADEIELADSGYGQGKILINPIHFISMYSAFLNEGSMVLPTIEKMDGMAVSYWKEQVFSADIMSTVLEDMKQIVSNPEGTGYQAYSADRVIAGKTGTAEIKADKEDTSGTELGWFVGMTPEETENRVLMLMMVEDVKDRNGSHYVVPLVKNAIDAYYAE